MEGNSIVYDLVRGKLPEVRKAKRWPFPVAPAEGWLTVALLGFVLLMTARSIEAANWVANLPSISLTVIVAGAIGMALAKTKGSPVVLHLASVLLGLGWAWWQTSTVVGTADTPEKLNEVGQRMWLFVQAAAQGSISVDILPFIFVLIFLAWLVGHLSAWFVFRSQSMWAALIPSGLAILTNLSYLPDAFAGYFFVYLFGGMLLAMRLHLVSKRKEWDARQVAHPSGMGASVFGNTFWFVVVILMVAWFLPTRYMVFEPLKDAWVTARSPLEHVETDLGRLFATVPGKKPLPMYSFGRALPFRGTIRLSDEVVFTVEAAVGNYWKAKTYDQYTSQGWITGNTQVVPLTQQVDEELNSGYRERQDGVEKVTLEMPTSVLFGASDIVKTTVPAGIRVLMNNTSGLPASLVDGVAIESNRQLLPGATYEVVSSHSVASVAELRTAGPSYPSWVKQTYLQLPDTLPGRVKSLSAAITRDAGNSYDKAVAIESYLRTIPYSQDIEAPAFRADGVDHFLFDIRTGYSDYFASAMAVMLRSVGVPARVAVGYNMGEKDPKTGVFTVRDNASHAWPEVFFPGYGWIEFEPTPTLPVMARGPGDASASSATGVASPPEDPASTDLGPLEEPLPDRFFPPRRPTGVLDYARPVVYGFGGLGLICLLIAVYWRISLAFIPASQRPYAGMARLGRIAGRAPRVHQTPNEYAEGLSNALPKHTAEIQAVTDAYVRTKYGGKSLTIQEEQGLRKAWGKLRTGLLLLLLERRRK